MLDYNTAVLNEYQRREALEDKAIADWESYHGTVLPKDMDMEQAEEFLATADEYDVDIKKPWFYQSYAASRYEGAFNKDKAKEYLKDWINIHGPERFLKDADSSTYPKAELVEIFFGDDSLDVIDFMKNQGFQEWK